MKARLFALFVFVLLLLAACVPPTFTPEPPTIVPPTITPAPPTPTALPPTVTATKLPTATPLVSPIITPTPFVSPILAPVTLPKTGGREVELSGPVLAGLIALLLSLALENIPWFKKRWETFEPKRLALAGVGLVMAFVIVGLHYAGALHVVGLSGPFIWDGLIAVLVAWWAFAGAGQLMYTTNHR